jgi:hypothetical protein
MAPCHVGLPTLCHERDCHKAFSCNIKLLFGMENDIDTITNVNFVYTYKPLQFGTWKTNIHTSDASILNRVYSLESYRYHIALK